MDVHVASCGHGCTARVLPIEGKLSEQSLRMVVTKMQLRRGCPQRPQVTQVKWSRDVDTWAAALGGAHQLAQRMRNLMEQCTLSVVQQPSQLDRQGRSQVMDLIAVCIHALYVMVGHKAALALIHSTNQFNRGSNRKQQNVFFRTWNFGMRSQRPLQRASL